ncbi:MAG: tetratricopeptide repeat protein [Pyrinomonadaceae bacterium]
MRRVAEKMRLGMLTMMLVTAPFYVFGQDLGSSNKIFKPTKKSPEKRSAPAKKKSSGSSRSSRRRTASAVKKRSTPVKKSETTASKTAPTKVVEIAAANKEAPQNASNRFDTQKIGTSKVIVYGGSEASYSERFENSLKAGNIARNQRDYVRAENSYRQAREIDPDDSRAIYGLGNIFSDQQRWEEAEKAYREAITLEPDSAAPYIAISFVLSQPVVGSNLGERYAEAEKMARQALTIAPDNAFAHDQLGVALELRGLISEETQNEYRKAIQLQPTFALAYAHLGRILRRNGKTQESSNAYETAIRLSDDVPTMILVADVMQSQQKYQESEQLLRRALLEDPRHPTALFLLGRALTSRKSFAEAEQVLKKSVEVSPNSFVSYALLGSLYSRQDQFSKAEITLKRALNVISENEKKRLAQEFEQVADGFLKQNRKTDAVRVYKTALSLDKDNKTLSGKLSASEGS